ncbi:beta-ketoacyl-[acyl-carrier-protein] synthase family protein [Streptomyces alkaliterrae]|uniref:Beta-ketoacyl-ACP synthase II n=1 Tax=Streptomyces alkaliterrae TaxID=2213162 RepID=A0A5P0YMR9_9ACTN|nr:beta-ketoacyl-[acyl-carrier-protein] synthase family protein [Streptomyces alkaliterrae]MBB1253381.1 beta-ketoacyl-[acyl-carrier-protein] synthase family protein [Streptomyces alkaliterrae]MBB1259175.1 beta-ketoacyl-[acyl-carrier-protein] synthase family protein [Streptomyces alkaliterrae]MQS01595.1 beta-ketoacyl-ACP synthase II [Streptomyces alkaliterrae]
MRRAVVTGVGVVAPGGRNREEFWQRIVNGKPAVRPITAFDASPYRSRIAAECDFDPAEYGLTPREVRRTDRFVQFAMASATEAVNDAGLETGDEGERVGVSLGSAVGASITLEDEYVVVSDRGRRWQVDHSHAMPFLYQALVPSSAAAELAGRFGARAQATVVSTGCTSGIDSIGHALRLIQDDEADVVIAGASDAPITPITVACFDAIRATTPANDRPEEASRPFDSQRRGFVLGEGAAVLVVEELEHAAARGARVYCEIGGYAARANGYHMTGLRPDGAELGDAIGDALRQARLNPEELGYISAHGSGTVQNDRHETAAYKRALGQAAARTPISSIKSVVGHSLGAIGSIEMAACALAIERGVIPPTANLTSPDPECDLDYTPLVAREARIDHALSAGSGFGGFQSAMVFSRLREAA